MGRHSKNNSDNRTDRLDLARKVMEFDAEDARLNAEYEKKREQMGSVERATADAEIARKSWGLRKR